MTDKEKNKYIETLNKCVDEIGKLRETIYKTHLQSKFEGSSENTLMPWTISL